jgi:uncharacterized protein YwgA
METGTLSVKSNDEMMLFFEATRSHGYLRQEIVHSLVYLAKMDKVLPFEQYEFNRYFMPFSRHLQGDIDDAVDFRLLEKELQEHSMAQWAYAITSKGTDYVNHFVQHIPEASGLLRKASSFVGEVLEQGSAVLLEKSYKLLNNEVMARLNKA